MVEQDYREKIKKLLALSESSNEHEAKSALLKAKKLMAEHKIAEIDLKDIDKKKVIHTTTEFRCSKRREAWMIGLATTIAENFCCQSYRTKVYNKQLSTICFVGFEDDIEACTEIFKYAVDCIRNGITDLKKESVNYSKEYTKHLCDGYGFGYVQGIKKAFEVQKSQDETGWGLIMTVPKEVSDETAEMRHEKFTSSSMEQMSARGFAIGKEDGKKFDPGTKLAANL